MLFFISINLESLKMSNKIQSEVWKHFDEISGSKNVKCKICSQILKRSDGSTSSMKRHLQLMHELLKEVVPKAENKVFCRIIIFIIFYMKINQ